MATILFRLCRTARHPFSGAAANQPQIQRLWLHAYRLRGHPKRSEEIPHLWLARLAGSCQSRPGHSAHCPVQDNVQQSQRCRKPTTLWHCSGESVPTFGDHRLQRQLVMKSQAEETSLDASPSKALQVRHSRWWSTAHHGMGSQLLDTKIAVWQFLRRLPPGVPTTVQSSSILDGGS